MVPVLHPSLCWIALWAWLSLLALNNHTDSSHCFWSLSLDAPTGKKQPICQIHWMRPTPHQDHKGRSGFSVSRWQNKGFSASRLQKSPQIKQYNKCKQKYCLLNEEKTAASDHTRLNGERKGQAPQVGLLRVGIWVASVEHQARPWRQRVHLVHLFIPRALSTGLAESGPHSTLAEWISLYI